MITLVAFVILTLATARATRMANIDTLFQPLRLNIINKHGENSWQGKLVRCYWCAGFWIAGLTTAYTLTMTAAFHILTWLQTAALWPLLWAATAYASSWVLDKEEA